MDRFEIENYEVLKTYKGSQLEYVKTAHPLYPEKTSLVIAGDHVTDEDGTGCVHTAPGHGLEDFYVSQKYGLEVFVQLMTKAV